MSAPATTEAPKSGRVLPPPVMGQEVVLIAVIAALWILLAIFTPAFLSAGSIQQLLWRLAPIGIMAVGMTMIIVTAGIAVSYTHLTLPTKRIV